MNALVKPLEVVPVKLDLGCGERRPPEDRFGKGWTGIDISTDVGADLALDLTQFPWPYDDASVDEVYSSHFFEHLDGPERIAFMQECYRIMKPGAKMTIIVPYWSSMRSIQDPFHKWPPVCEASFLYFNKGWMETNKLTHYGINVDFDFGYGYTLNPSLNLRNQEYQMAAAAEHINAVYDLIVTLTRRPNG